MTRVDTQPVRVAPNRQAIASDMAKFPRMNEPTRPGPTLSTHKGHKQSPREWFILKKTNNMNPLH
jgi:hypothetical protein